MQVDVQTTQADWYVFIMHLRKKYSKESETYSFIWTLLVFFVIGIALQFIARTFGKNFMDMVIGGAAFMALLSFGWHFRNKRVLARYCPTEGTFFTMPKRVTFDEEGVKIDCEFLQARYAWKLFSGLEVAGDLFILMMDSSHAILVPGRCVEKEEFLREIGRLSGFALKS